MPTIEREQFLIALANMALDAGEVWFAVDGESRDKESGSAIICDLLEDCNPFHRVTFATMRKGLGVIKYSAMDNWHNAATDEDEQHLITSKGLRLYMTPEHRHRILSANKKSDLTEIGTDDALAILECGLFGQVVYR